MFNNKIVSDFYSPTISKLSTRQRRRLSVSLEIKTLVFPEVMVLLIYLFRLCTNRINYISHYTRMAVVAQVRGQTQVLKTKLRQSLVTALVTGLVVTKLSSEAKF